MAECMRYRSKYSCWARLSEAFRSLKALSYVEFLRSLEVRKTSDRGVLVNSAELARSA
jgi:hypothetical protein